MYVHVLCVIRHKRSQDYTTGDEGPRALWSSRWPWACMCISPNSRSSAESDPFPHFCSSRHLLTRNPLQIWSQELDMPVWKVPYPPVRPWSINTCTLLWDRFVPLWVVNFYNKHIVSENYAKFSPLFLKRPISLLPLGRWKIRCHDTIRLDGSLWIGNFDWVTLWDVTFFAAEMFYQTPWSDCWGCGLRAGIDTYLQKCNVNL